jgi:hypothetical protein
MCSRWSSICQSPLLATPERDYFSAIRISSSAIFGIIGDSRHSSVSTTNACKVRCGGSAPIGLELHVAPISRRRRLSSQISAAPRPEAAQVGLSNPDPRASAVIDAGVKICRWRGGSRPRQSAPNLRCPQPAAFGVAAMNLPPRRSILRDSTSNRRGSCTCSRRWLLTIASKAPFG